MSLENAYKSFELPGKTYYASAEIEMPVEVDLRHMTVKEVRYFSQLAENADLDKFIDNILRSCCKTENILWDKLLDGDRVYMFYMVRALTMDNFYSFQTTCENCGKSIKASADLFALKKTEFDDKKGYPLKVKLPKSGKVAEVTLPDREVEKAVEAETDQFNMTAPNAIAPEEEYRLRKIIKSVEGLQGTELIAFISTMHYMDWKAIEKAVRKNTPGLDLEVIVRCKEGCGHANHVMMSFRPKEFFLVSD